MAVEAQHPARLLALLGMALVVWWGFGPREAEAHPLGMSSVNRYVGVAPRAGGLELDYLLDLAELPAYAEIERLDLDHDGRVTPAERDRYLDGLVPEIVGALTVTADGRPVTLREVFRAMEAPPGQSGLSTLRVALTFRAAPAVVLPPEGAVTVTVRDVFRRDRPGWREIDAVPSDAVRLVQSSVPREAPRAGGGLAYPTDPTDPRGVRVRPPRVDAATLVFARAEGAEQRAAPAGGTGLEAAVARRRGGLVGEGARLAALVRDPARGPWATVLALGLALLWGAAHALSPGHGKALVGSYLVGARGTVRHALALGLAVTVTHTASVFALGLVALAVERTVGSERLLRTLELASGALVIAVALQLLPGRWRTLRGTGNEAGHHPGHGHDHGDGVVHSHAVPESLSWRGIVALGVSGGIVPCPGALVLLLAAMGVRRVGFGLVLLVAFSVGLAGVLSAVGAMFVLARDRLGRLRGGGRVVRVLPVVSALAVLALGLAIVLRALVGTAL